MNTKINTIKSLCIFIGLYVNITLRHMLKMLRTSSFCSSKEFAIHTHIYKNRLKRLQNGLLIDMAVKSNFILRVTSMINICTYDDLSN